MYSAAHSHQHCHWFLASVASFPNCVARLSPSSLVRERSQYRPVCHGLCLLCVGTNSRAQPEGAQEFTSLPTNRDQLEICSTVSPAPHISLSATLSFKPQVSLEQGLTRTGWLLTHPVDACLMPVHQQFCAPGTTVRTPWGPGGAATALLSTAGPHTHTHLVLVQ